MCIGGTVISVSTISTIYYNFYTYVIHEILYF